MYFTLLMTFTLALNKNNDVNELNLQYRDNIVLQEITTVSTSHSQWLQPFNIILSKSLENIKRIQNILDQVTKNYSIALWNLTSKIYRFIPTPSIRS